MPRRALSTDGGPSATGARSARAAAEAAPSPSPAGGTSESPRSRSPKTKRRKIRKGTHSCWACKRKKIRCTFSTPDGEPIDFDTIHGDPAEVLAGVVCDACRRRGTPCISQELPETSALSAAENHSRQVDDRLGRMEALVEMLVKNVTQGAGGGRSLTPSVAAGPPGTGSPMATSPTSPVSDMSRTARNSSRTRQAGVVRAGHNAGHTDAPSTRGQPLEDDDEADQDDGGPDNIPSDLDTDMANRYKIQSLAASYTGYMSPAEGRRRRQTPTTTTWFGHERGLGDEEQPGSMPGSMQGPATPDSATVGSQAATSTVPTEPTPATDAAAAPEQEQPSFHEEYMRRYQALAERWPSPEDLEIILKALERPVRSGLHKVLVYTPISAMMAAESPPVSRESARTVLVLPPVGTHLVLVAQVLLFLASFLQHMHPMFDPALKRLSVPHRVLMQRAVCVTNAVVTGNDSLIGSFEGVQCLVMQGVFQSNQGNLRRAWLAFRRAMTMMQLMGLQRGFPASTVKYLNPKAVDPLMPKCLWFRIVYADRYLSLMLGLPQGAPGDASVMCPTKEDRLRLEVPPDADAAKAAFMVARTELQKIEMAHAVIAGRIIERNEAWRGEDEERPDEYSNDGGMPNPLSTQSIDVALQRASRSMPAQWWLTPVISDNAGQEGIDGATNAVRTQQLIDQLFHYHLLTQLHLPYMLGRGSRKTSGTGRVEADVPTPSRVAAGAHPSHSKDSVDSYAYSKITCVSASREVLSRFLSLRSCKQVTFFCRCIDFFALLASMTLCLAHLDSHRKPKGQPRTCLTTNDYLAHQRLSDRGMMERVLESMDEMAELNEDALSAKSAAFLRRMLDVEEEASLALAAAMGCVDAQEALQKREASQSGAGNDNVNGKGDLRVWVPFLGTIRINKDGILRVKCNERAAAPSSEDLVSRLGEPVIDGCSRERDSAQSGTLLPQPPVSFGRPVPSNGAPSQFNSTGLVAPYPMTAGDASFVNPLSGLDMPPWPVAVGNPSGESSSSGPSMLLPNSDSLLANPYLFYAQNGPPNNINVAMPSSKGPDSMSTAQNGLGGFATDGYGSTFSGEMANVGYSGGSADDWTLQGVDFAFFENLLMHGGLDVSAGDGTASAPHDVPGPDINTTPTVDTQGNSSGGPTTVEEQSKDGMGTGSGALASPLASGNPGDDAIATNSQRAGLLGDYVLWS